MDEVSGDKQRASTEKYKKRQSTRLGCCWMIKFIFLVQHHFQSVGSSLNLPYRVEFISEQHLKLLHNCIQSIRCLCRRSCLSEKRFNWWKRQSFNDAEWEKFVGLSMLYSRFLFVSLSLSRRFLGNFMLINVLHRCLSDTSKSLLSFSRSKTFLTSSASPFAPCCRPTLSFPPSPPTFSKKQIWIMKTLN